MLADLKTTIAILVVQDALDQMAKKVGVQPKVIMDNIVADPEGDTARNFNELLVQAGVQEVPKLLGPDQPALSPALSVQGA